MLLRASPLASSGLPSSAGGLRRFHSQNKKRRGRSKYLLSVDVKVGKEEPIAAKIVCVRNKANRKDWLLPLYALTQVCVKKRSFVFTEKDGK